LTDDYLAAPDAFIRREQLRFIAIAPQRAHLGIEQEMFQWVQGCATSLDFSVGRIVDSSATKPTRRRGQQQRESLGRKYRTIGIPTETMP